MHDLTVSLSTTHFVIKKKSDIYSVLKVYVTGKDFFGVLQYREGNHAYFDIKGVWW